MQGEMEEKINELKLGYIKSPFDEANYCLGAGNIEDDIVNPTGDWLKYFPSDESQTENLYETYGCTSFNSLNAIEALAKYLFNEDWNKSDRYNYIAGDVDPDRGGGDPHTVLEGIRKQGTLNESDLPFKDAKNINEFNSPKPLTKELKEKAEKQFLNEFVYKHEWLPRTNDVISTETLREALKLSPVSIAVFAWAERGGKYFKPVGKLDTHWTTLAKIEDNGDLVIKDTYLPYTKVLEAGFTITSAKRHFIRRKTQAEKEAEKKQLNYFYNWFLSILKMFTPIKARFEELKEESKKIEEVSKPLSVTPEPIVITPSKYDWSTPKQTRISIRRIGDDCGLIWDEKNIICAVIQSESGFDTKAVNKNKDGSFDYGLCQFNSYWYIEKGKYLTKEEALNDPEKCVRLMIKRYKAGFLKDWWGYKSGAYKKFLT